MVKPKRRMVPLTESVGQLCFTEWNGRPFFGRIQSTGEIVIVKLPNPVHVHISYRYDNGVINENGCKPDCKALIARIRDEDVWGRPIIGDSHMTFNILAVRDKVILYLLGLCDSIHISYDKRMDLQDEMVTWSSTGQPIIRQIPTQHQERPDSYAGLGVGE